MNARYFPIEEESETIIYSCLYFNNNLNELREVINNVDYKYDVKGFSDLGELTKQIIINSENNKFEDIVVAEYFQENDFNVNMLLKFISKIYPSKTRFYVVCEDNVLTRYNRLKRPFTAWELEKLLTY